jgi:hypothetical protein
VSLKAEMSWTNVSFSRKGVRHRSNYVLSCSPFTTVYW